MVARMMMTKCLTHFLMLHKLNKKQCFKFAFDCISNEAERDEVARIRGSFLRLKYGENVDI